MHSYKLNGVCATKVDFELDGKIVKKVHFYGGCNGNLKAISQLVEGMDIDEVIKRLEGILCENKPTSCTDQFAKVLNTIKQ